MRKHRTLAGALILLPLLLVVGIGADATGDLPWTSVAAVQSDLPWT
ncbi:hypothetical protein ABZX85_29235 [Streptomyces sp. NPDC004539]